MRIAAILCLATAVSVQIGRDATYPRDTSTARAVLYVTSPALIQRLALGFDGLAADVYWIRVIQHYGRQRLSPPERARDFSVLYPLLDLTTSLDPYFSIAYRFGAIFLSEPYPGGPGRPDLAVTLLRKGIEAQPAKWQYYHDVGFVYYWSLGDPVAGAEWIRRASQQPDAPNWLAPVAAAMLTQGKDRASARYLWQQILSAREEWLRRRAEIALAQLDALDAIDQLKTLIARAREAGMTVVSWDALVRAGFLRGIPADPAGVPYILDPESGTVRVSERSPLFPMPSMATQR